MKHKLIAVGLLCVLLTACAPDQDASVTEDPEESTSVTTTLNAEDSLPPIVPPSFDGTVQSGIGEKTEQYRYTEGEYTVLNVSLTLPVANVEGNEALQKTLSERLDALRKDLEAEIDRLYQQYLSDYKAGREGLTTPSVQVRFELHYFTAEAVSMTYILTETTGDGMVYTHSYHSNLDLRVGSEIRLTSLLKDEKTDGLLTLLIERLKASPPEGIYENAEQILSARLDSAWYIAGGNLLILLEPGEIAPLSSQSILLTFTEAELSELLSDYGKALL